MKTIRTLAAGAVVLGTVAIVQQVYIVTSPRPQQVLNYPEQHVLNREDGQPVVHVGQELRVQGTKCNEGDVPVAVHGVTSWVSIDPPGTTLDTGSGVSVRKPGCEVRTYSNQLPDLVVSRTVVLTAELGTKCVTWRITGREDPVNPLFLSATWQSEPFDLCR
jgi:hypothetical protein